MEIHSEHINTFLSKCKSSQWAGVFFSSPGSNGFECWIHTLNQTEYKKDEYFVFSPFQSKQYPSISIVPIYKNADALQLIGKKNNHFDFWQNEHATHLSSTSKDQHHQQFDKYISAFSNGNCTKAILSTIIKEELKSDFDIGSYVLGLRKTYPQAFVYVLSSPFAGTWIGATPETLLKWNEDEVMTMSLAGTKNAQAPNVSFGNKEKNEQEIVTNYITEIFKKYFSNIHVNVREEFNYGDIIHLLSRVKADRKNISAEDIFKLVEELHPTPAVAGFPLKNAIELINTTELHPRLYYSGYLGPVRKDSGELVVNLRCMTLADKNCYVFAGGGITADSVAEAEWAETRLKANALLKLL